MKAKSTLRNFLALAGSSLLAISSANAQATYYWDGNNDTTGYGTAGGTWANPTTGTLTSGWTTAINGDVDIVGNSITTNTSDTLTFGRVSTGFSLATGTITVSGTVNSGNMNFGTNAGTPVTTLTGGTIHFGNAVTIGMSNLSAIIESQITGASTSISKTGSTSTLRFSNTNNSYTGLTSIIGTLQVTSLTDGGSNSSIGASSNAASNLIIGSSGGGTLSYIGSSNASTDRLFSLGNHNNAGVIASNGDGTLNFTNTGAVAYSGTADQTRILGLSGTNTGLNILSASIGDNGTGAVSFTKSGTGNWVLANNSSSYTGQTAISQGGTLSVSKMADYGTNSAIGRGTAGVSISFNGSLVYTGTGDDTNRLIRFDGNGTILNNGSGALNFTETGNFNVQVTNNTARTFTLGGTNGGTISGPTPTPARHHRRRRHPRHHRSHPGHLRHHLHRGLARSRHRLPRHRRQRGGQSGQRHHHRHRHHRRFELHPAHRRLHHRHPGAGRSGSRIQLQVIDGATELRLVHTGGGSPYDTWVRNSRLCPSTAMPMATASPTASPSCLERPPG
jgi:autotransporter-associated beta strand protein